MNKEAVFIDPRTHRIEQETRLPVPEFIYCHPKITRKSAIQVADMLKLNYENGELIGDTDDIKAKAGLRYCRDKKKSAKQILEAGEVYDQVIDIDGFLNACLVAPHRFEQLELIEQNRRQKRDFDILKIEIALLQRKHKKPPNFQSLSEYCGWLSHSASTRDNTSLVYTPTLIYWDLLEHYYQIINAAKRQFDPVGDWEAHLKGNLDLAQYDTWKLNNVGRDVSYFSRWETYGRKTAYIASEMRYDDTLLVHTATARKALEIIKTGEINSSRICFSSGRVIGKSLNAEPLLAFIFPRSQLERVYSILPFVDSEDVKHEREMRSHEPVNIGFCVGLMCVTANLLKGQRYENGGTWAIGKEEIIRWGQRYEHEEKIWNIEEELFARKSLRS